MKFLSNMLAISKKEHFCSTPHQCVIFIIFLCSSCNVVFSPPCMQMFFCFAVIISVSVVADAFIASSSTNFPKEFTILGKQLFLHASVCISYDCNAWPASH